MAPNQDVPALLEKASRLRQTKETWECASLLARAWITPSQETPCRPYLLLIANLAGKVLFSHVQKQPPEAEKLLEYLLQAMIRPELGAGRARRPQVIYLDDEDYVTTLTPALGRVGYSLSISSFFADSSEDKAIRGTWFRWARSLPRVVEHSVRNTASGQPSL